MTLGRPLLLGLLAPAGFVAGHHLSCLIAYRDTHERAMAMQGHGFVGPLLGFALLLGALVLVASIGLAARRRPVAMSAVALTVVQVALFVAAEAIGHAAIDDPALWVGVLSQAAVALLLSLALRSSIATGRALARRRQRPRSPASAGCTPQVRSFVIPRPFAAPAMRRGPPLLVAS